MFPVRVYPDPVSAAWSIAAPTVGVPNRVPGPYLVQAWQPYEAGARAHASHQAGAVAWQGHAHTGVRAYRGHVAGSKVHQSYQAGAAAWEGVPQA